jgi:hypothetical protein
VRETRGGPVGGWLSDRGTGALDYIAAIALVAAVAGVLVVSPIPSDIARRAKIEICKVVHWPRASDECETASTPVPQPVAVDPDIPAGQCLTSIENEYLEPGATVGVAKKALNVMQDGGSQVTLRKYIQPDGTPAWEVWDMGWSDAGALAGINGKKKLMNREFQGSAGAWATLEGTNAEIYEFTNEKEALAFQKQQRDYRIGDPASWAKVAVRTLPISGGFTRLLGGLPVVGDSIEDFMGGREPERKPDQEYYDGGLWLGAFNDVGPAGLPASLVGRDWATASGGLWQYNKSGDKTLYFQASNQVMESVEFDLEPTLKALKLDKKVGADVVKGLQAAQGQVVAGLVAQYVKLYGKAGAAQFEQKVNAKFASALGKLKNVPPPLLRGLATDSGAGIGGRATNSVWYGFTYDKNNKLKSFTEVDDEQLSWHYRVDAGVGPVSAWYQSSLTGERTRDTKTVDLTDPQQKAAFDAEMKKLGQGPIRMVEGFNGLKDMFDRGVGTMAKTTYDYDVQTLVPSANVDLYAVGAGLSVEWEKNHSELTGGQYWKPGVGWLPWKQCGL